MQTQRDHVHAHTFMMGRLSSALVEGDPTGAEIPGRRAQTGLVVGVVLLVLVVAGFAVYGWIVPGGSRAFRQPGVILVEKESGDRYVYRDGFLHPVSDLTSAMLIQGSSSSIKLISRNSLKDVPRGVPLGLPGAPPRMPDAGRLSSGPWLTCLPGPGSGALSVHADAGIPVTLLPEDRFLVVRAGDGTAYVIAGHVKHRVTDDSVLVALGAAAIDPPAAPALWLNWLPDGAALGPARIPGAGGPGPVVGGRAHRVGTLFRQGADQLFVLRRDGLAPLSRTEFLIADAAGRQAPVDLDPADVVAARRSPDRSLLDRLPDLAALKLQPTTGQAVCQQQTPLPGDFARAVALAPAWVSPAGAGGAARMYLRQGSGMVVTPVPAESPNAPPKVAFVSDDGVAHGLPDAGALGSLKLNRVPPVPFPRELLAALPQGPQLSREAVTAQSRGE